MKKVACIVVLVLCCVLAGPPLVAKPVCMDGTCQGNEPNTCPEDCVGGGGDGGAVGDVVGGGVGGEHTSPCNLDGEVR